jgi:tetratricopeptide (TPR) repeat protein/two-component sensor histidine kinase
MKRVILSFLTLVFIIIIIYLFLPNKTTLFHSAKPWRSDTLQAISYNKMGDSLREYKMSLSNTYFSRAIELLPYHKNSPKETRILTLSYIGKAHNYSRLGDMEKAIQNASIALSLAKEINNYDLQAKAEYFRVAILNRMGKFDSALVSYKKADLLAIKANDLQLQTKIRSYKAKLYFNREEEENAVDSLTKTLQRAVQSKNKRLIAESNLNLGLFYLSKRNYDAASQFCEKALTAFKKINYKKGVSLCYQNIGKIYYNRSKFDKAIEFYKLSLAMALKSKDKFNEGNNYNNLAEVYACLSDHNKTIDYYFKSMEIKDLLGNQIGLAMDYSGLADFYFAHKQYLKALSYYQLSLKLHQKYKYLQGTALAFLNIGNVYSEISRKDSADNYFHKSLKAYNTLTNPSDLSDLYINKGIEYSSSQNFLLAEHYIYKAIWIKMKLSDQESCAAAYCQLARVYLQQASSVFGDAKNSYYTKSVESSLKSFDLAFKKKSVLIMMDASLVLKEAYLEIGEFNQALFFAGKYEILNDSLNSNNKKNALTFGEKQLRLVAKQTEINQEQYTQKLNREIILSNEVKTSKQSIYLNYAIVLFLISVLMGVGVKIYYRKRGDVIFQKQMASITQLKMQNAHNTMAPHFFFNLLSSFSADSNSQALFQGRMDNLSLLLRQVVENIDQTSISLEAELLAVKSYIDLQRVNIPGPLKIEYQIADGTNLQRKIPAMILEIPVENALKNGLMHLEGEKLLRITIADKEDHQHILVEDNGIGLKASIGRSTGTGTGLKVLMQTINLLNAKNKQKIQFNIAERKPDDVLLSGVIVSIIVPFGFDFLL